LVDTARELTSQERNVARLAAEGLSNAKIGAELFISARTGRMAPEEGLRQAWVTRRKELKQALALL
jgi:DNA-binding CsgD family transcriptional regulator